MLLPDAEGWEPSALRILEVFSRTWGGSANIIIPCEPGGDLADVFWSILKLHDPDYYFHYRATLRGRQLADPVAFEEEQGARVRAWAQRNSMAEAAARELFLDKNEMSRPLSQWTPGPDFDRRISAYCAPFTEFGKVRSSGLVAESGAPRQLVPMERVAGPHRQHLSDPDLGALPAWARLLVAQRVGALSPAHRSDLQASGCSLDRRAFSPTDIIPMLDLAYRDSRSVLDGEEHRGLVGGPHYVARPWADELWLNRTPLRATETGCLWYFRGALLPEQHQGFVLVVGPSAKDFCYAMALDRLFGNAGWVPEAVRTSQSAIARAARLKLATSMNLLLMAGIPEYPITLTSFTLSRRHLLAFRQRLVKILEETGLREGVRICRPDELALGPPRILCDEQVVARGAFEPFVGVNQATEIPTPEPTSVRGVERHDLKWKVEVEIDGWRAPRSSLLAPILTQSGHTMRGDVVRTSAVGVTYSSQVPSFMLGEPEALVRHRPRLRLLGASDVVSQLLGGGGLRVAVSQAGRFLSGVVALWGSLDAFAADLRSPASSAVVRGFIDSSPSGVAPGVYLEALKRRFLDFADIHSLSKAPEEVVAGMVDRLCSGGVLERGLILSCEACNFPGWYRLESVGRRFRCARCGRRGALLRRAWKQPPSGPLWYFALSEVVFRALSEAGLRTVALALDHLRRRSTSFDWGPCVDVFDGDKKLTDLDICAVVDGRLVLGEAKETAKIQEKAVSRVAHIAQRGHVSEFVFATVDELWAPATMQSGRTAFGRTPCSVRFLTRQDLYS